MRSDQDGIYVKIDVNRKVWIICLRKKIYGRFWSQGEIRWGVRWLTLKVGEPIIRSESRLGLTSPPQIGTVMIEVGLLLWESLLESREYEEEGRVL